MNESKFFYLGKITRKFSFKGELIIFLYTDSPSTYYDLKMVYVKEDDTYLPYFISEISKYKNNSIWNLNYILHVFPLVAKNGGVLRRTSQFVTQ